MADRIDFLGLKVSQKGIHINPYFIKAINKWYIPIAVSKLSSFDGLLQYFRRFIKNFCELAAPFTNLTRKGSDNRLWNDTFTKTFNYLKYRLTSASILTSTNWDKTFHFHIDASPFSVGAHYLKLMILEDASLVRGILFEMTR